MKLEEALKNIVPADKQAAQAARSRWLSLAKPLFSLGVMEDIITRIAAVKGREMFSLDKRAVVVMCADNGVVDEGVAQCGSEVTAAVAENILHGRASISLMSAVAGADVFPVDIGINTDIPSLTDKDIKVSHGTADIALGAALTREQTIKAIEAGIGKAEELKALGYDIIATGEMGIGNTTTSSAVVSVLLDTPPEAVTGRGAGLSSEGLEKKISVIKRAVAVNRPDRNDPVDVLSKVGGLDIAALAGVFIGGALCRIPVIADGFISCTAALASVRMCPEVSDCVIGSHLSSEPACRAVAKELGIKPPIHADMHLGEGTGAVMLLPLLDMCMAVYGGLYKFGEESGVERYRVLK